MERDSIIKALRESVAFLFSRDRFLLTYDVHECAIAHRIAVYLEAPFAEFDVDCEYNNDLDSESGRKAVFYPDNNLLGFVRPDIIVHHRGQNGAEDNMLVVELKKLNAATNDAESDRRKLMELTSANERNHYAYQLGALLRLGVKNEAGKCTVEWFEHGQLLGCENWDE